MNGMGSWTVFGMVLLGVLACVGLVQVFAWMAVRLSRKGNKLYKVVPIGGAGKNTGDQMSLLYACLQWEANPAGQELLLYDVGLDDRAVEACQKLAEAVGVRFVRSREELARLLEG